MSYTVGSWTFDVDIVDTVSTAKSLSVPDLSYALDYSTAKDNKEGVLLKNVTGTGVMPAEELRYQRSRVANVYDAFDEVGAPKLANKEGVRLYHEVRYVLTGTNSTSGDSLAIPMRGWIVVNVPVSNLVTGAMITDLYKRVVSAALGTGQTTGAMLLREARGDINPTL